MRSDPNLITASAALAAAVGSWLMLSLGVGKGAFEWKRSRKRCVSCRRDKRDCTCAR